MAHESFHPARSAMSDDQLFDGDGRRLYLTAEERAAFLVAARQARREVRTLCETLHYTGCRLSQALALTPRRIDFSGQTVTFETLKKRRRGVFRAVPVPGAYLDTLNMGHGILEAQRRPQAPELDQRLWPWHRSHAWRLVKAVMAEAGIDPGQPHATPKGLRHAYGIAAINAQVPLNMLRKWMGHASIETTALYANAIGAEQQAVQRPDVAVIRCAAVHGVAFFWRGLLILEHTKIIKLKGTNLVNCYG